MEVSQLWRPATSTHVLNLRIWVSSARWRARPQALNPQCYAMASKSQSPDLKCRFTSQDLIGFGIIIGFLVECKLGSC